MKSMVLVETSPIVAPQSVVDCVHGFIEKICTEDNTLIPALAKSFESEDTVVTELLNQLDKLLISSS